MTRPLIGVFDCFTQEETTREMNDEEYAQYLIDQENNTANQPQENE